MPVDAATNLYSRKVTVKDKNKHIDNFSEKAAASMTVLDDPTISAG